MMITEPLQVLYGIRHNALHELTACLRNDLAIPPISAGLPRNTHPSRSSKRQVDLFRLVPVLRAAAGGCDTLAGAGGRVGNALVVIVRNRTGKIHSSHFMTTEVNATPVTCVRSADLKVHATAAVQMGVTRRVCAQGLAQADAKKKRNETEGSHQGTGEINDKFEKT
jgi:hypothetical protein